MIVCAGRRGSELHPARRFAPLAAALLCGIFLAGCSPDDGPSGPHAGIVVSRVAISTVEGGAFEPFTVALATAPGTLVDVELYAADGSEGLLREPGGFSSSWLTLTFTPDDWNVPQVVELVPQQDTLQDGNQTYIITASAWTDDALYSTVPDRTISVTNADDDFPGVTVSETIASTSEGGATDTFTVRLNYAPTATVTVPVTSADVSEGLVRTATSALAQTVSLTFTTSNWATPQTLTIAGVDDDVDDDVDDGNQTFLVTVGPATGAPEYASIPQKSVAVTNTDDDMAGITVTAGASPLDTSESGTTATFTVALNSEPAAAIVLAVRSGNVAEGLLSAGAENGVETVHLAFGAANWSAPQTVTVTGQDEVGTQVPGDQVLYDVTVGPATGDATYAALATQAVSVFNADNDAAAVLVPVAGGAPLQTRESGAPATATFELFLSKAPASDVVVPISVAPGDATEGLLQGGSSPSTPVQALNVTFTPADYATHQLITVVAQPDATVDGDRTYPITVGTPTAGPAEYTGLAPQTVQVTNVDTDVAGFTLSRSTISTNEGGAVATFTVVLAAKPLADVVVPVSTSEVLEAKVAGGDSGGSFVGALNLTFTSVNWQTPQTVQVQGQLDSIDDGNVPYTITVGPTTSGSALYHGLAAKTIGGTSVDVDISGLVIVSGGSLSTTEGGGTDTFTVRLTTKPTGTVAVALNTQDASEALLSPASLSFTTSNWDVVQTVTVTGQPDTVLDGDRLYRITLGPITSVDPKYDALADAFVQGFNLDDEVGVSEGSLATPLALTAGTARAGQVGPGEASYYVVSGLTAGATYAVRLGDPTASVTLTVDDESGYLVPAVCTASAGAFSTAGAICIVTAPASGTLYLRVTSSGVNGAGYTLTVSRRYTFTSTDVPKSIPDSSSTGVTSNLLVAGGATALSKVTVTLSITHSWDSDLSIYLISPAGTIVTLSSNNGGSDNNYTSTTFDDAAALSIIEVGAPFTGSFRPETPLSTLAGQDANGTWMLKVFDEVMFDSGTLTAWSITVM